MCSHACHPSTTPSQETLHCGKAELHFSSPNRFVMSPSSQEGAVRNPPQSRYSNTKVLLQHYFQALRPQTYHWLDYNDTFCAPPAAKGCKIQSKLRCLWIAVHLFCMKEPLLLPRAPAPCVARELIRACFWWQLEPQLQSRQQGMLATPSALLPSRDNKSPCLQYCQPISSINPRTSNSQSHPAVASCGAWSCVSFSGSLQKVKAGHLAGLHYGGVDATLAQCVCCGWRSPHAWQFLSRPLCSSSSSKINAPL